MQDFKTNSDLAMRNRLKSAYFGAFEHQIREYMNSEYGIYEHHAGNFEYPPTKKYFSMGDKNYVPVFY